MFFLTTLARRAFFLACFFLTLTLLPLPSYALTVLDVPNPRVSYDGWVTDMAQILSPVTEIKLNQIISKLEHENGSEIAVVTVRETTTSPTPKAFTTKLFNYWKIGKKEQNNGVLFLVSVNERRIEIETGKGIRNILSNADVNSIIQQKIIPQFKQGNLEKGILVGTESLVAELSGYQAIASRDTANSTPELPVLHRSNLNDEQSFVLANSKKVRNQRNTVNLKDEKSFVLFWLLFVALIVFVIVFWVLSKLSHNGYAQRNSSSGESSSSFYENDGDRSSFSLKTMMYKSYQNHDYFNSTSVAEGHGSSCSFNRSDSGDGSSSSLSDGDSGSSSFGCDGGDFGGGSSGGDGGGGDW